MLGTLRVDKLVCHVAKQVCEGGDQRIGQRAQQERRVAGLVDEPINARLPVRVSPSANFKIRAYLGGRKHPTGLQRVLEQQHFVAVSNGWRE